MPPRWKLVAISGAFLETKSAFEAIEGEPSERKAAFEALEAAFAEMNDVSRNIESRTRIREGGFAAFSGFM